MKYIFHTYLIEGSICFVVTVVTQAQFCVLKSIFRPKYPSLKWKGIGVTDEEAKCFCNNNPARSSANHISFYDEVLSLITQTKSLILFSGILGTISTFYAYHNNVIIAYGDAESHLNIAKRIVHSVTPGLSQLGGIWLPLPHLLMLPLVLSDYLWKTGLAGAIVSGICFIISSVFLFKLVKLITKNTLASFVAFLVFALNPNILYLQATPMTELPLIMFFVLSSYYFVKYLYQKNAMLSLMGAAFFGLCATLSRYDGWLLVGFEAAILIIMHLKTRLPLTKTIGNVTFFATLACFGVFLWIVWGNLILGDPFYFTTSEFSAKSQQDAWLARGELPAYHNLLNSVLYYTYTAMANVGSLLFIASAVGLLWYLVKKPTATKFFVAFLLLCPFVFYVVTLYMGQSVIFIPSLTPENFEWKLFNVRYGVMMVPICAFFFSYLLARATPGLKVNLIGLLIMQTIFFATQSAPIISLADGTTGLSRYKHTSAQDWLSENYDNGYVLVDDFARSISIIRSPIRRL